MFLEDGLIVFGTLNLNTPERHFAGGGGEGEDEGDGRGQRSSSESCPVSCRLKLRGMGDDGGDSATSRSILCDTLRELSCSS